MHDEICGSIKGCMGSFNGIFKHESGMHRKGQLEIDTGQESLRYVLSAKSKRLPMCYYERATA